MRRAGFRALLLALGLQLAVGSGACAAGPDRGPELRTIRGVVRVVGNEPFSEVVVSSPSDATGIAGRVDYEIVGPLAAELRAGDQGRTVTLEGAEVRPSRPWFRHAFAPTRILRGGENR